jgi:hypothetical protein
MYYPELAWKERKTPIIHSDSLRESKEASSKYKAEALQRKPTYSETF